MKAIRRGEGPPPAFIVSLHDVSPLSWPLYRPLLERLDALGGIRSSLLVVPDFHRRGNAGEDPAFCAAMLQRQAAGDELVLHGWTHTDDGPVPLRPAEILRRRILTHEGEFAALGEVEAVARIHAGLTLCREQGWLVDGFVPPGWMSNAGSQRAIRDAGFRYRTDTHALYALPEERRLPLPTVVMSSRSAWRRRLFAALNRDRLRRFRHAPVIRLALHPVDLRFAASRRFWWRTIETLHGERRAVTKRQWLAHALTAPLGSPA